MKILCLVIAIANLALLLWEFRMGAFAKPQMPTMAAQEMLLEGEQPKAGLVKEGN